VAAFEAFEDIKVQCCIERSAARSKALEVVNRFQTRITNIFDQFLFLGHRISNPSDTYGAHRLRIKD